MKQISSKHHQHHPFLKRITPLQRLSLKFRPQEQYQPLTKLSTCNLSTNTTKPPNYFHVITMHATSFCVSHVTVEHTYLCKHLNLHEIDEKHVLLWIIVHHVVHDRDCSDLTPRTIPELFVQSYTVYCWSGSGQPDDHVRHASEPWRKTVNLWTLASTMAGGVLKTVKSGGRKIMKTDTAHTGACHWYMCVVYFV